MSDAIQSSKDVQAYETAMLNFLNEVNTIIAKLEREGHSLTAPLKAEWRRALLAQGTWRATKWVVLAAEKVMTSDFA
jgi:hypothetical protein